MIVKEHGKDFFSEEGALTLSPYDVGARKDDLVIHEDGWAIKGEIIEDYTCWVEDFSAIHPRFGRVWGNFEGKVYADSEEGFQDFYAHHPPWHGIP